MPAMNSLPTMDSVEDERIEEAKVEEAYFLQLYEEDSDELSRVMAEIAQLRSEPEPSAEPTNRCA